MDLRLPQIWKNIILLAVLVVGVMFCIHALWSANKVNSGFGFPLDDSWIHLQFARNLHDHGAFSFYKNEMSTSGSTSPLYTILLAIGFFFTSNEFILSYTLGIGALAAAALLLILEPRLQWIAISGMETTLFIALLLAVLYFYYSKKSIPLGITGGLLLWARPEAVILFAVIAFDVFYNAKIVKSQLIKKNKESAPRPDFLWPKKSAIYALAIAVAYVLLNLYLSGSVFPNTYAAKLKFYSISNANYPKEVFHYLTDGHFLIPAIFTFTSICMILWKLKKRQPVQMLIPLLWSLLLFIAYWKNLPKLFQNGRYLMPLLPFFLLISIDGMKGVLDFSRHKLRFLAKPKVITVLVCLLVLVVSVQFGKKKLIDEEMYIDFCGYIGNRQVKTAFWIRDNLPQDAIVATHDIGAIAFYSGCHVIDMVGLVSPEMIKNIGRIDLLMEFLIKNKVTHIATLRNWFEIVNMKPLFLTDPERPEIMEVFQFDSDRTHFTSHDATKLNEVGMRYLSMGNASSAMQYFQQSLLMDTLSAPTNYLIGRAARTLGNFKMAEERFNIVSQLQPEFPGLAEQIDDLKRANVR